jgi:hypothetical protein
MSPYFVSLVNCTFLSGWGLAHPDEGRMATQMFRDDRVSEMDTWSDLVVASGFCVGDDSFALSGKPLACPAMAKANTTTDMGEGSNRCVTR